MTGWRDRFHVPEGGAYLLAHSAGCLPVAARGALEAGVLAPWQTGGGEAWDAWLGVIADFRSGLAGLMGGRVDEICPQPSVSAALGALLGGLPRTPGRDVLLASAHSFPSIGFVMQAFERFGYRLELIDEAQDVSDPDTWLRRIGSHVAAVVPMLVHSNTGLLSPVAGIAEAARAAGAVSIVDICQAVGVLPIDMRALGADAAIGSCLKWLCGGPGAGFLWVRAERIADFAPLERGWFSHADPFAFDIRDFRYAPDAQRFWGGTPSIAPFALAAAGIATVAEIGVPTVFAHNRACIAAVEDAARRSLDMSRRGGTLCLTSPAVDQMETALRAIGCRIDRRRDTLRLSFHAWNTEDEAAAIGDALTPFDFALA